MKMTTSSKERAYKQVNEVISESWTGPNGRHELQLRWGEEWGGGDNRRRMGQSFELVAFNSCVTRAVRRALYVIKR